MIRKINKLKCKIESTQLKNKKFKEKIKFK